MSTHSPSSPKDPALVLAPDLPLSLQPNLDPRTSTSSPTDMHSDSKYNHQNISRESSENAASSSPEMRNTHAPSTDASKYIGTLGRPVEQIPIVAPERSSDNQSASTRPTQSPAPSLYAQPANKAPQDETEIQWHILAILQKMCDKMEEYEAEDNGRPTSTGAGTGAQPHKASFKKTLLGVPKRFDQGQQQFNPVIEDYEQIFPEDPYGEEAGPNARVFKVYNEEAAAYDADMIGQSSDSSDVLLVFAGLFSAVLTTFVTQTSQALDTDNSAISNSLLSEVVHLLRAQENGTSFGEVAPAITGTTPTANDLWVNGLWFTSLTLSLATALFAVLTKQWLRQYMVKTSGTIRDRSLIRQFRFAGMRKWHVVAIIGILPILLHLALGVFLVGLVIFLVPRSLPMACVVSVITVIIYSLYFISNLVPVFDIQCPYRTPLSDILNILLVDAQNLFAIVLKFICIPFMPNERDFYRRTYHFKPLGVQEHDQVQGQWGSLSLDIIKWLLDTSSNPSVHTVATEAIGGLPPSQREKVNFLHQHFTRDLIEKCLILSGRYPACRPGCVGKLERLARSFPLSQRKRNNDVPRWNVYAAFHDLEDIRGMVSAVGLGFNKEDCANTFNHLLDLPDVRLSPCAWVNLFRNSYGPRMTRCRLEICKRVLEHWDPIPQPHSWKEQTAPVPMSYVLTRGFLEAGILAFGDCDPFKNLDTSESLPLLRNSLSRPPDSPGLRALLTMHHFLDSQNAYESSIDVLSLLHLLWQHIRNELHRHPTALDYVAVFHTTSRSLLESPMLKGNGWMDSVATSRYCATLLDLCSHALFNGPSAAPEFEWNCSERVVELTFPGPTAALKYHAASTSHEAVYLWGCALVRDVKGAFTDFVKFDVLGRQAAFLHISESLLQNFISGLLRQLEHPSPHPEWVLYSVAYLHEPHNLLKTCKILAGHPELASEQTFFDLARVDPDNIAWEGCREHLKTWRPDDTDLVAKFEDSLKALDRFFETRRRRLDPATLFRSIFGRHGNASVVSPSTDVEMGLTVAAPQISPNELSASQERTNAVVAGELIIEQDRETSREGDLAVGSKPLNETDDSLRRTSSRRSELADLASLYLDESYVEGDHFRPSDAAYHPLA